jgi:putative sterol carrier protein
VDGGAIQARPGPAVAPDLTIHTPFEVWADVMSGKVDGQQAFMDGLYTVDGDVELLMRFDRFFGADDEPE